MADEMENAVPGSGKTPSQFGAWPEGPGRPLSYWFKRLLACNPFYLLSAGLLLFGLYRVSIDFQVETTQLAFNFTSLQVYEFLLVGTAILLASRRIWYDSTLLVVLENLFVLVPFILVSQAALIDQKTVWGLCGFAAALAVFRTGSIRQWLPSLPLISRLAWVGGAVLVANTALPVVYRTLEETKVGTKPDWGAAYVTNEFCWWLLLPAICALVNLLPRWRDDGKSPVQRRWFPVTIYSLWALGTAVHLYALGYVYDYDLRRELLTPTLWVLAWTMFLRTKDVLVRPIPQLETAVLSLPLVASLVSAGVVGNYVFLTLTVLNVIGYGMVWYRDRENRGALSLLLATSSLLFVAWPKAVGGVPGDGAYFAQILGVASAVYLILATLLSRSPKLALVGAFTVAIVCGVLRGRYDDCVDWAIQAGLVFLLVHSLRWVDYEHTGAGLVRAVAAMIWVGHSYGWVRHHEVMWPLMVVGGSVLVICVLVSKVLRAELRMVVPVAAVFVALCAPANFAMGKIQTAPMGILAVGTSFLLFAMGTVAALTKHRWDKNHVQP